MGLLALPGGWPCWRQRRCGPAQVADFGPSGPAGPLFQIKPPTAQAQDTDKAERLGPEPRGDSRSSPVQELLHRLAVDSDGHPGVGVEGELQAVEDAGLLAVLSGAVGAVLVPVRDAEGQGR